MALSNIFPVKVGYVVVEVFIIDNRYLNALLYPIVGYANVTMLDLLNHLRQYYGMLAPKEFTANCTNMNVPYDHNPPIEDLYKQLQEGVHMPLRATSLAVNLRLSTFFVYFTMHARNGRRRMK
jgi:hypothetical protein